MDWDTDFTGAARLKRARAFQRLSQEALGKAFGVSKMTILRWENGEGTPGTHYRKVVDEFIQNAERIIAAQLAPKARYSSPPVVWVSGRLAHAR
jgi:transcriptional regulator with XRE-family HTH domain